MSKTSEFSMGEYTEDDKIFFISLYAFDTQDKVRECVSKTSKESFVLRSEVMDIILSYAREEEIVFYSLVRDPVKNKKKIIALIEKQAHVHNVLYYIRIYTR